jgi:protein phosphatase
MATAKLRPEYPPPELLDRLVREANERIAALARARGCPEEVGTTLVAVLVVGNRLFWTSVGDSRVYLLRRGELTCLTEPQNGATLQLRQAISGWPDGTAGDRTGGRGLTNYLGRTDLLPADASLRPLPLEEGDWLLLCTDGLFDSLEEEVLARALQGDPHEACELLVSLVMDRDRPNQDNVTAVVLAETGAVSPAPPPQGWLAALWHRLTERAETR